MSRLALALLVGLVVAACGGRIADEDVAVQGCPPGCGPKVTESCQPGADCIECDGTHI